MARTIAAGIGLMEYPFRSATGFWRWVDLCEQGGVDSIWQNDRIVSRTPALECMTALAAIAGRTRRIKFGVNVVGAAMRDPVLLAKQCATIDVLSEGRMLPGFGIGSARGPGRGAARPEPAPRRAVRWPHAARVWHRQPARPGMGSHAPRSGYARTQDRRSAGNHLPS